MLDIAKVTPAPWFAKCEGICCGVYQGSPEKQGVSIDLQDPTWADAQFIALARNAFDVMMRREWGVKQCTVGPECEPAWYADWSTVTNVEMPDSLYCKDPFTALVEADKWYRENVEKVQAGK